MNKPLSSQQLDALLGPAPQQTQTPKMDPTHAPAAMSASGTILNLIRGLGKNTGDAVLAAGDQGAEDLHKNAEVQAGAGGPVEKIKSEAETGMHLAGDFSQGVFAPITGAIKTVSDAASDNPAVQEFAKHPAVSALLDKNSDVSKKMDEWSKAHPEASRAFSDIMNTVGLVAGGEGAAAGASKVAKVGRDVAETGGEIGARVSKTMAQKRAAADLTKVQEIVSPRLDAAEAEKAINEGRVTDPKGPLRDQKLTPSDRTVKVAEAAQEYVKPNRTFAQNANSIKGGIEKEATDLKTQIAGADHPYTFKELQAKLKSVEMPELIKTGGPQMEKAGRRVISKFMELAQKGKGNVSELLDARKSFDAWVEKEYPKIFDADGSMTGIRLLVRNVRSAANDFIEESLPDGFGYKESLQKQSALYDALENVSEKASRGAPKSQGEVNTNVIDRMGKRHPKATKALGTGIGLGGTLILGDELGKHLAP